jgi:hypothetical protein
MQLRTMICGQALGRHIQQVICAMIMMECYASKLISAVHAHVLKGRLCLCSEYDVRTENKTCRVIRYAGM